MLDARVQGGAEGGGERSRALRRTDQALLAVLALAFVPALVSLARVWSSVEYYSHGFLVPLVSLYAVYHRREALRDLPAQRDRRGLVVLVAALLLYGAGAGAGLPGLQGLAFVGAVAGAVLLYGGARWLRALAFPVGFLLFMVPLPEAWLAPVIVEMRLFVTGAAVELLHAFGVEVARDGNVILLPGGESLFVAEACSGITSLVTLTPLAVFLACFTEPTLPRRLVLIAFVVPIAMGGNLARVVGTVLAAQSMGAERAAAGMLHESWGLVLFTAGCVILLAVGSAMRRLRPPPA